MLSDWSIDWVILTELLPLSLVCVISAISVADWGDPTRWTMFWRMTALLFPFLLCCRMVHLLLPEPSSVDASQLAEFTVVAVSSGLRTLDWTMRHSFRTGIEASIVGKQSKMFAAGSVDDVICTTMFAVVQFHPAPGQFGPA